MATASLSVLGGGVTASATITTLSPVQIRNAYGFSSLPNTVVGSGQTIGIIDFGDDTTVASDLATFDTNFGIAAPPSLTVVNENGGSTLPTADSDITETALDVEYATRSPRVPRSCWSRPR